MINSDFLFKINLIYKTTAICLIFSADLSFSRNKFLFFSLNLSKHNIYLTVKFTNKIPPPFFPVYLVYINDQKYSRFKQMNKYNIDFFYIHLFTMRCQCVLNRSSNQDAHYSCPR